jgi:hypothetical protein
VHFVPRPASPFESLVLTIRERYVEAVKQSVASLPKVEASVVKKGSKKKSRKLAVPEMSDAQVWPTPPPILRTVFVTIVRRRSII